MGKEWVVVAHQAGAKVYERKFSPGGLKLLEELKNEEARLSKEGELHRHERGSNLVRFKGRGGAVASNGRKADLKKIHLKKFAKEIVAVLETGLRDKSFDTLVLFAEPHILGDLRASMGARVKKSVSTWINKDLGKINARNVLKHLATYEKKLSGEK